MEWFVPLKDRRFSAAWCGELQFYPTVPACDLGVDNRRASESSVYVKPIEGRLSDMKKRLPLTNDEGEIRELTEDDFKNARPASKALPAILGPGPAEELLKRKP